MVSREVQLIFYFRGVREAPWGGVALCGISCNIVGLVVNVNLRYFSFDLRSKALSKNSLDRPCQGAPIWLNENKSHYRPRGLKGNRPPLEPEKLT